MKKYLDQLVYEVPLKVLLYEWRDQEYPPSFEILREGRHPKPRERCIQIIRSGTVGVFREVSFVNEYGLECKRDEMLMTLGEGDVIGEDLVLNRLPTKTFKSERCFVKTYRCVVGVF